MADIKALVYIIILFYSSFISAQKTPECTKTTIESSPHYNGLNWDNIEQMRAFNADSTNTIDIVRVFISKEKKKYTDSLKRVYIKDGKAFLFENDKTTELPASAIEHITDLTKIEFSHYIMKCGKKSNNDCLYRIFVKSGNELIMSFWVNDYIENADQMLIGQNAAYIKDFENIK